MFPWWDLVSLGSLQMVSVVSLITVCFPQVLSPWWDLVSSGSLQMLTVVALMALSIDVVTKFGTAVKCTPLNGTISFGGSQQVSLNAHFTCLLVLSPNDIDKSHISSEISH